MSDTKPAFDADGFLLDPQDWDIQVAADIALDQGIPELGRDHVKLLEALRRHFLASGELPPMRHVCRDAGLDENCVTELVADPKRAWRIAGLPNPGEEAKAYLESSEQVPQPETREKQ